MELLLSLLLTLGAVLQEHSSVGDIQVRDDSTDTIQPVKVSHRVDEIRDGGQLVERYNYIVYEFENEGAYLWARTYLDEVDRVSIYGPFTGRDETTKAVAPDFELAVMDYLKRRFHHIDRLNPDENAHDAYKTVWDRPKPE